MVNVFIVGFLLCGASYGEVGWLRKTIDGPNSGNEQTACVVVLINCCACRAHLPHCEATPRRCRNSRREHSPPVRNSRICLSITAEQMQIYMLDSFPLMSLTSYLAEKPYLQVLMIIIIIVHVNK